MFPPVISTVGVFASTDYGVYRGVSALRFDITRLHICKNRSPITSCHNRMKTWMNPICRFTTIVRKDRHSMPTSRLAFILLTDLQHHVRMKLSRAMVQYRLHFCNDMIPTSGEAQYICVARENHHVFLNANGLADTVTQLNCAARSQT